MPDEVEDISVVETTEPVGSVMPVDAGVGSGSPDSLPPVDDVSPDVKATELNLDANDSSLTNNSQQIYNENYAPDRVSESAVPLTAVGQAVREAEKEEKKAAAHEFFEQQSKEMEHRAAWLERDHDFAGMKMSGHDLDKLINFYANNPAMQDQLKDRLVKSGKSPAQADKTLKDFSEYMKILKKESEGKDLTDEEKRRKLELSRDRDVQEAAKLVVDQYNAGNAAKITPANEERILANTETSSELRRKDFEVAEPSIAAPSGQVVYFGSYSAPAVKTGIDPQAEFNAKAVGKSEMMPKPLQLAMGTPAVEVSGLGI